LQTFKLGSGTNVSLGTATILVAAEPLGVAAGPILLGTALVSVAAQPVTPTIIFGVAVNPGIVSVAAQPLTVNIGVTVGSATVKVAAQPVTPGVAAGTLIASITNTTGTDQYGNAYLQGSTSYLPGSSYTAVNINGGSVNYFTASSGAGPWIFVGSLRYLCQGDTLRQPRLDLISRPGPTALKFPELCPISGDSTL
jgi:hypothetical protein